MTITYTITAPNNAMATQIARNRAHADGWQRILGTNVRHIANNTYEVTVWVSGLH